MPANPTTYQFTRFPNGLRVATAEMPHMASVCLGLWVGTGSRHEAREENGAAHFIEHMLFKGTRNRTSREIVAEVEGLGGYLNAFTGEDHTCYYARAKSSRWPDLLEVLQDMFFESTFPLTEVRREREVIKEERAMYLDDPAQQNQELLNTVMWPDHPLGRPIEGTSESLNRLNRKNLLGFMARHYVAGNVVLVAAGDISHERLIRRLKRFAGLPSRPETEVFEPIAASTGRRRFSAQKRRTEQTQIALGIQTCSRTDSRRYAVRLLNALLGENMSSRLYQVLREEAALAYSVDSHPNFFADTGCLTISSGADSQRIDRALRLIHRELARLRQRAPGRRELTRTRDYVLGQFDLYLENTENHMNWIGEMVLGHDRILSPAVVKKRLTTVTARDIRGAANEFFAPEHLSLAIVGPRPPSRQAVKSLMGTT